MVQQRDWLDVQSLYQYLDDTGVRRFEENGCMLPSVAA